MLFSQPELLTANHEPTLFDCGKAPLNQFLQRYALVNQANGSARTFVSLSGGQMSGYYSLAAASAEQAAVPSRVSKGPAKHPIPMLLLARLAVDHKAQGQGLGRSLLQSALGKYLQACEVIGARALMVHAIDEAAIGFYQSFGFEPSPVDAAHLYLLTKDIRKTLG
jgi:GNAT superfamily N-acetyltransferase